MALSKRLQSALDSIIPVLDETELLATSEQFFIGLFGVIATIGLDNLNGDGGGEILAHHLGEKCREYAAASEQTDPAMSALRETVAILASDDYLAREQYARVERVAVALRDAVKGQYDSQEEEIFLGDVAGACSQ